MSRSQALEKYIFKGMLGVMLFENTSNLSGTVMPLYQAHFGAMEWKRDLAIFIAAETDSGGFVHITYISNPLFAKSRVLCLLKRYSNSGDRAQMHRI
jgi:hypothetical protein